MHLFHFYNKFNVCIMCIECIYAPPPLVNKINFTDLYGYIITKYILKRLRSTRN